MRLWSLHPSLLDQKGLVALWREALLAQHVRSDADYVGWQLEANAWAERVGPILEANFPLAVRRKFDFVGLHALPVIANAHNDGHNRGMAILDRKVKVLEDIIGDGIAQP